MSRSYPPPADRLWARVTRTEGDGCWEWQGNRHQFGHGSIWVNGRHVYTHRLAWELVNGPIPSGLMVCHHCDNPPCCRPEHLFLGTANDNIQDSIQKDRHVSPPPGSFKKLSVDAVVEIRRLRADGVEQQLLAAAFGISKGAISMIVNRQRWSHVP